MVCGTVINVSLIINFLIALYNLENQSIRKIVIPIFVSFIIIKIVFFFLFGRIFCGFFCPFGFTQDIVHKLSENIHFTKLNRNTKFLNIINVLSKIFLVFFLCGITALTFFVLFFPNILAKLNFPFIIPVACIGIVSVIFGFLSRRFFCNLCPYGSFAGLFVKINLVKLKKENDKCTKCGACYEACPMKIKSVYLENEKNNVATSSCIFCGECLKKCPKDDALNLILNGKTICKSSQEEFLKNQFPDNSKEGQ